MSLVSETEKRKRTVELGPRGAGTKALRQTFELVYKDLPAAMIREVMIGATAQVTEDQVAIGNPPTRVIVDGDDYKPLNNVTKNIEVLFGQQADPAIFELVETVLIQAVQKYASSNPLPNWYVELEKLNGWENKVGNISNWQWTYVPPRKGKKVGDRGVGVDVDPKSINSFPVGSVMILKPREGNDLVGLTNRAADWIQTKKRTKTELALASYKGDTSPRVNGRASTRRGYLAMATAKIKRSQLGKSYTIWAGYTSKYAIGGERWIPDWMTEVQGKVPFTRATPYIMVMSKAKRSGGRRGYMSEAKIEEKILKSAREATRIRKATR